MAIRLKEFRDPYLEVSGEVVGFYPREFWPFDNFAAIQVDYLDRRHPTSEHAYHYTKFIDEHPKLAEEVLEARSPHDALHLAHENANYVRADWDDIKLGVMRTICELKLRQNPYVERKLRQTGSLLIVEDSPKDSFWGWGPDRKGRNELGKIWMDLRTQLSKE